MIAETPEAVVFDGFATTLTAARSLRRRGIRVTVVPMARHDVAQYSRAVSESVSLIGGTPEDVCALLRERSRSWRGRVLLPNDVALETLARHGEELRESYRFVVPDWGTTRFILRKNLTHEAAAGAGVRAAVSHGLLTRELAATFRGPFPAILKPLNSAAFQRVLPGKLFRVDAPGQLPTLFEKLARANLTAELLEYIPGPDTASHNYVCYRDGKGRCWGEAVFRKLRKRPPSFGIGRVWVTDVDPRVEKELIERARAVLDRIAWHGAVSAEFKIHADTDEPFLIEINGRTSFAFRIAEACGLDLNWMIYRDALGLPLEEPRRNAWRGAMIHLSAEIANLCFSRREESFTMRAYVAPYLGPKVFAVWDWRDPVPFFMEWVAAAGTLRARLRTQQKPAERTRSSRDAN